jgi:hypothetical protein
MAKSYTGVVVEAPTTELEAEPEVEVKTDDKNTQARVRMMEIESKTNNIKNYQED